VCWPAWNASSIAVGNSTGRSGRALYAAIARTQGWEAYSL
jgi:hypothetical protein